MRRFGRLAEILENRSHYVANRWGSQKRDAPYFLVPCVVTTVDLRILIRRKLVP